MVDYGDCQELGVRPQRPLEMRIPDRIVEAHNDVGLVHFILHMYGDVLCSVCSVLVVVCCLG